MMNINFVKKVSFQYSKFTKILNKRVLELLIMPSKFNDCLKYQITWTGLKISAVIADHNDELDRIVLQIQ